MPDGQNAARRKTLFGPVVRQRIEHAQRCFRQGQCGSGEIFPQVAEGRGAGDQQEVGRALQQPGQRHLHRRGVQRRGYRVQGLGVQRGKAAQREERHVGNTLRGQRIDQVGKFSQVECRNKFAVAADPGAKVAGEYQTQMQMNGKTVSDRTSFVIAPDGKILMSYTDRNPDEHIQKSMAAVKQYAESHS